MKKYLFMITLSFFALSLVNIHFALLGFVCMAIPLVVLFKTKKKVWCQKMCPRANLYTTCGKLKKTSRNTPMSFIKGNVKWIMLTYFSVSLLLILMSTIAVTKGKLPLDEARLFMLIPLPNLPQLVNINTSSWILHLSYRMFSMMLTTTLLGLTLALIYKPRTWCTICPISTVSGLYINNVDKNKSLDK